MAILTEPIGEDSVMPSLGQANLSEGKIPSEISHISVMSVQPSINVSLVARDKHIIEWRGGAGRNTIQCPSASCRSTLVCVKQTLIEYPNSKVLPPIVVYGAANRPRTVN